MKQLAFADPNTHWDAFISKIRIQITCCYSNQCTAHVNDDCDQPSTYIAGRSQRIAPNFAKVRMTSENDPKSRRKSDSAAWGYESI